ncbi:MAG: shikimate dehydrogenase [Candidatus Bathyarchaeota archaeon]|nr:shikimate dehydrogenase [Candidatus Bathyarchaeota archaeon]
MKVCYLIGHPVGHSMSPAMHNAAFKELGLDYRYEAVSVEPERLTDFLNGVLRRPTVRGANVTIPHKISVMRAIDVVDEAAAMIGAVNTVVNDGGVLKGYNTDGVGALRALEGSIGELRGRRVLLLGAGGAARAVAYVIAREAEALTILNRTPRRAVELAGALREKVEHRVDISATAFDETHLRRELERADILINATPIGMHPDVGETPVPRHLLHGRLLVFDLVYNPPRTRLLREAEDAGAETLSGVEMLVYQGAEAFLLWTGKRAPVDLMLRAVRRELGG